MRFNKIVSAFIAFCLMATLAVAMGGCEDLGVYEDTEEYYSTFGDIALISASTKEKKEYSVDEYFYSEESREDFLVDEDGAYNGVPSSDYVYMAIPLESTLNMDTIAMYMQSQSDVTVYINVFVTDKIPSSWKTIEDNVINNNENNENENNELPNVDEAADKIEKVYDDPNPETRVGEITIHLKAGKWNSFLLDTFTVSGVAKNSIDINEGQYILLQIRNNSGVRDFDEEKQIFVDPQTGLELQRANVTMTNLLIRALDIKYVNEAQGGK